MVDRAEELADLLLEQGFPESNIIRLFNAEATSQNIEESVRVILEGRSNSGADRLFFYFGGHGDGDAEQGFGYLITYDFDPSRPTQSGFLMSDFVGRHFRYSDSHHFLVALDSCGSGLAIPGRTYLSGNTDEQKLRRFATFAAIRGDVEPRARNILAAGTGEQRALWETGGVFTKALIRGLRGDADIVPDGVVQFDELALYLDREVTMEANRVGVRQDPYSFSASAFGDGKTLFLLPDFSK